MLYYHATVLENEDDGGGVGTSGTAGVVERIKKLLERGLHVNTPPAEASTAMRLARDLLVRHQLTQADVMQDGAETHARHGTQYVVRVRNRNMPNNAYKTKFPKPTFVHCLCIAMEEMFSVKAYFTQTRSYFDTAFNGIRMQCKLAADEFEACFNTCMHYTMRDYSAPKQRTDYAEGFARGVLSKVRAIKNAHSAQNAPAAEVPEVTTSDLILYNERSLAVADAVMKSLNVRLRAHKKIQKKRARDDDAFARGKKRGEKFEFGAERLTKC